MLLALDRQALAEEQDEEAKVLPSMPSHWQPQVYRGPCGLPLRVDVLGQHEARLHGASHATCDGSLEEALDALDALDAVAASRRQSMANVTGRGRAFWHPWLGAVHVSLALIDLSTPSALASVSRPGSLHRYSMVDSS
ncbi:hypothetical protein ACHAPE_001327 [Trichoderma viride]